eukprot:COSAG01_NODE_5528_length_4204_cov_9.376249_2_plen_66_part_00
MLYVSRDRCANCAAVFKALEALPSINVTAVTDLGALEPICQHYSRCRLRSAQTSSSRAFPDLEAA